ncbi:hypothetical protein [Arthrobacter sp. lap29]|uniref:hypothetical protein n=1 Tax=Arthrobacter sp. lap29 TaxID=3056122 RepID=UPI0028F72C84|nr:hypothetical protein [Arthrobacter sp. lap29]
MSEAGIVAIIIGVLGILGGGGFWTYRQSRSDAPVRQRDADLAVAEKSQQMAMIIAVAAQENSDRLRADMDIEREARQQLTGRVESLETRIREQDRTISHLRRALQIFTEAWDDLSARWEHHRAQDHPPDRPRTTD